MFTFGRRLLPSLQCLPDFTSMISSLTSPSNPYNCSMAVAGKLINHGDHMLSLVSPAAALCMAGRPSMQGGSPVQLGRGRRARQAAAPPERASSAVCCLLSLPRLAGWQAIPGRATVRAACWGVSLPESFMWEVGPPGMHHMCHMSGSQMHTTRAGITVTSPRVAEGIKFSYPYLGTSLAILVQAGTAIFKR